MFSLFLWIYSFWRFQVFCFFKKIWPSGQLFHFAVLLWNIIISLLEFPWNFLLQFHFSGGRSFPSVGQSRVQRSLPRHFLGVHLIPRKGPSSSLHSKAGLIGVTDPKKKLIFLDHWAELSGGVRGDRVWGGGATKYLKRGGVGWGAAISQKKPKSKADLGNICHLCPFFLSLSSKSRYWLREQ